MLADIEEFLVLERRIDLGRLARQADLLALNPIFALLPEALAMKELP